MTDTDNDPYGRYTVTIKGVVFRGDQVLLAKEKNGEWELPGGRIEKGENPEGCLVREIMEETGWSTRIGRILDTWVNLESDLDDQVLVVTYGCHTTAVGEPVLSDEHSAIALFDLEQLADLPMRPQYRDSVLRWSRLREQAAQPTRA